MRTFRIVAEVNDRLRLGADEFTLPAGEVTAEEVVAHLNAQCDDFLRFYVGKAESVCYTFLNDKTQLLKGRIEL